MRHLSDDDLTALALGAPVERGEHIGDCRKCAGEVASLRRTADLVRDALIQPVLPPAAVWERLLVDIAAEPRNVASASAPAMDLGRPRPGPTMTPD